MSNVVPLRPRGRAQPSSEGRLARETAMLVSDLVDLVDQLHEASERAAALGHPALRVERTVQSLLDAVSALERATDTLTDEGELLPF